MRTDSLSAPARAAGRATRPAGLLVVFFVVSVLFPSHTRAQTFDPAAFPRGVTDARRAVAYVANGADGVDAVSLGDGRRLWATALAARPLITWDGYLLAQAPGAEGGNTLRLVLLDAGRRGALVRSYFVTLPNWVDVKTSNTDSFSYAVGRGNGSILLSWRAESRRGGGQPPPEHESSGRQSGSGAFRLDLATGEVEPLEAPQTESQFTDAAFAVFADARLAPYRRRGKQRSTPWVVGGKVAAVVRAGTGGSEGLSLQTYDRDGHVKLGEVKLTGGTEAELALSLDGRHLFVGEAARPATSAEAEHWRVYPVGAAEGSRRVAVEGRLADGVVFYGKLFALVELSGVRAGATGGPRVLLRCYRLSDGGLLWERTVVGPDAAAPPEKRRVRD